MGDIDGNGIPDLIVNGRYNNFLSRTTVGVFFDASLSSLDGRNLVETDFKAVAAKGYPWSWDTQRHHPQCTLAVGDVNGDGFDDILFSIPIIDNGDGTRNTKGEIYLVLGDTRATLGSIRDFSIDPPDFTFYGVDEADWAGWALDMGDLNADGREDIIISAPQADGPNNTIPEAGEVYVITSIPWEQGSMQLLPENVQWYVYGSQILTGFCFKKELFLV